MPFAETDLTNIMGYGGYVGEVREGPGGQLYEWVEGVDGLGNPVGFWRGLRRFARRVGRGLKKFVSPLARFAHPFSKFIPGVGPAIYAGGAVAKRAGLLGTGQIAQAPDGQLYEYVEGVDGLGNPVGFWRALRRAASGLISRIPGLSMIKRHTGPLCQGLPRLAPCVQRVPGAMPAYQGARQVCNILKRAGLAGAGGLMEAPDGQLYEVIEGIGEFGERRRLLRRVRLVIPAYIGPARRRRAAASRVIPARPAVVR